MTQVMSALRVMGTLLLVATEIVLVALFAVGVSSHDDARGELAVCLFLHCIANLLIWGNEGYALMRRGRDPSDIFYVLLNTALVISTGVAFAIFAVRIANAMPIGSFTTTAGGNGAPIDQVSGVDFAGMGPSAAYAVLILTWVVTLLSIQSLTFAVIEKLRAINAPPPVPPKTSLTSEKSMRGSFLFLRHRQPKKTKPTRSTDIDWDQRPLPITIIAVDRTTVKGNPRTGWKITEVWEEPETMSIQEEADLAMAVSQGDETLVHVPLTPLMTTHELEEVVGKV